MAASVAINHHANLISKISTAALADIEGINPAENGFCRGCGLKDEKSNDLLMGTFETLKRHIFVASHIPATKWDKLANNVDGLKEISKAVKGLAENRVTAYYDPSLKEGEVRRLSFDWKGSFAEMTEISGIEATDATFVGADSETTAANRKAIDDDKIFVFVCSHTVRDARCGYCGPVIVDMMKQDIKAKKAEDKIFVYPCSHVGGHAYAGNVLVYGKNGGIVYGNFCPSDVEILVNHMLSEKHCTSPPKEFEMKVRGYLGEEKEIVAVTKIKEEAAAAKAAAASAAPAEEEEAAPKSSL